MMNLFYGLIMIVVGFSFGTVYNWGSRPVPKPASCPVQVCPKLPDNYFTIESVETQHCVNTIGDTIISKVIKESRVEIE